MLLGEGEGARWGYWEGEGVEMRVGEGEGWGSQIPSW